MKDCKGNGNPFILFHNWITDPLNHLQLPHSSLQLLDKFSVESRMELILFYFSPKTISPNNRTLLLVSLRHRVREERSHRNPERERQRISLEPQEGL